MGVGIAASGGTVLGRRCYQADQAEFCRDLFIHHLNFCFLSHPFHLCSFQKTAMKHSSWDSLPPIHALRCGPLQPGLMGRMSPLPRIILNDYTPILSAFYNFIIFYCSGILEVGQFGKLHLGHREQGCIARREFISNNRTN